MVMQSSWENPSHNIHFSSFSSSASAENLNSVDRCISCTVLPGILYDAQLHSADSKGVLPEYTCICASYSFTITHLVKWNPFLKASRNMQQNTADGGISAQYQMYKEPLWNTDVNYLTVWSESTKSLSMLWKKHKSRTEHLSIRPQVFKATTKQCFDPCVCDLRACVAFQGPLVSRAWPINLAVSPSFLGSIN